jgi:voltage-gated potassium channel
MRLMFEIIRREVDRADEITLDVITQALVGYLIIGIAWMAIYAVANLLDVKIFAPPSRNDQMASFAYFSFSTLTSLGPGDITPVDPLIRMVAIIETILGIFYNATVIARACRPLPPALIDSEAGVAEAPFSDMNARTARQSRVR